MRLMILCKDAVTNIYTKDYQNSYAFNALGFMRRVVNSCK